MGACDGPRRLCAPPRLLLPPRQPEWRAVGRRGGLQPRTGLRRTLRGAGGRARAAGRAGGVLGGAAAGQAGGALLLGGVGERGGGAGRGACCRCSGGGLGARTGARTGGARRGGRSQRRRRGCRRCVARWGGRDTPRTGSRGGRGCCCCGRRCESRGSRQLAVGRSSRRGVCVRCRGTARGGSGAAVAVGDCPGQAMCVRRARLGRPER
mmetsp:Transcript_41425/g.102206  ORF Transcript_41425/g.102206 Transcript_41425/m.102206 type:complete len:209 (+) Transcript_41425:1299-1925(+)